MREKDDFATVLVGEDKVVPIYLWLISILQTSLYETFTEAQACILSQAC